MMLAAGVVGALCWPLYRREATEIEERLWERESTRTGLLAHLVLSELRPVVDDLGVLADGDGLRAFLAIGRSADLERALRHARST